jgi:hypothetical protein
MARTDTEKTLREIAAIPAELAELRLERTDQAMASNTKLSEELDSVTKAAALLPLQLGQAIRGMQLAEERKIWERHDAAKAANPIKVE